MHSQLQPTQTSTSTSPKNTFSMLLTGEILSKNPSWTKILCSFCAWKLVMCFYRITQLQCAVSMLGIKELTMQKCSFWENQIVLTRKVFKMIKYALTMIFLYCLSLGFGHYHYLLASWKILSITYTV